MVTNRGSSSVKIRAGISRLTRPELLILMLTLFNYLLSWLMPFDFVPPTTESVLLCCTVRMFALGWLLLALLWHFLWHFFDKLQAIKERTGLMMNLTHQNDVVGVCELLKEDEALVKAKDEDDRTPLHVASYLGWIGMARCLLHAGADVNAVDRWKLTPLAAATEGGNDALIELLQSYGGLFEVQTNLQRQGSTMMVLVQKLFALLSFWKSDRRNLEGCLVHWEQERCRCHLEQEASVLLKNPPDGDSSSTDSRLLDHEEGQDLDESEEMTSFEVESFTPNSLKVTDPYTSEKSSPGESYADLEEQALHADAEFESLPEHLKGLILFCSLFPSQYEFRKDELVQMWIAEGLIGEIHGEKMEDVGNDCFVLLLKKGCFVSSRCDFRVDFDSVFSVAIYNPGNLLYKVNPIKLLEPGNRIALNEYFIVDGKLDGAFEITKHLSFFSKDVDEIAFRVIKTFKHLRTLLVLSGSGSSIEHVPRDLFLSLKELRTLNLNETFIVELPSSIRNAKSLQYLDLSKTRVIRLPESIDSLHNLQSIKLRDCVNFVQLPKGLKKLIHLRHIDLDIIRQLRIMPLHLGNLTNLQTLSAFLVGRDYGCRIGELKNLNNLRGVLRISRLENVASKEEAEEAALADKKYLQRLELRWSNVFNEKTAEQEEILECLKPPAGVRELQIQHYAGSKLPTWISNPWFAELVVLTLYRCRNCELLPSIGKLPMLKSLSIIEMNEVEKIDYQFLGKKHPVDQELHAFSKLEILEVDIMLSLKEWKDVNMGDLPSLLKLTVDSCPELTILPSLSWLKSLKHFELRRCPKILSLPSDGLPASLESFIVIECPELKEWCCMMEGEDWRKICHLPSIWLDCEEVGQLKV